MHSAPNYCVLHSYKKRIFPYNNAKVQTREKIVVKKRTTAGIKKHANALPKGRITENFRKNDANISNILTNFSLLSDTLAKANLAGTLKNVNIALSRVEAITTKINNGEGTIGMLVNDQKLYDNLNKSASQLNALIEDMKLNPYRYVNISVFPPSKKRMVYTEPVK